jgi:RES domain-containing protein
VRLWRISDFADLSGDGGLLASGRWHSQGRRIVYLSDHPASALVEILVNLEIDFDDFPTSYQLLAIEIPDNVSFERTDPDELPLNWRDDPEFTRAVGDEWLMAARRALLCVPSAIVPAASNWLLNPAHPDISKVQIVDIVRAPLDPRLLRAR